MAGLVVKGYREILQHLDEIEPGLKKATMKEINAAARVATLKARGYVPAESPISGWARDNYQPGSRWYARSFDRADMVRGIQTRRGHSKKDRKGYVNEVGVTNKKPAGMIYELAGSKSRGKTNAGRRFVQAISDSGLHAPLRRVVIRAVIEEGPAVANRIKDVLQAVERRFNIQERVTWR